MQTSDGSFSCTVSSVIWCVVFGVFWGPTNKTLLRVTKILGLAPCEGVVTVAFSISVRAALQERQSSLGT